MSLPPDTVATWAPRGSSLHAHLLVKPTCPGSSPAPALVALMRAAAAPTRPEPAVAVAEGTTGPPWRLFLVLLTSGSPRVPPGFR